MPDHEEKVYDYNDPDQVDEAIMEIQRGLSIGDVRMPEWVAQQMMVSSLQGMNDVFGPDFMRPPTDAAFRRMFLQGMAVGLAAERFGWPLKR